MQGSRFAVAISIVSFACVSVSLALGPQHKPKPVPIKFSSVQPILGGCVGCHSGPHPKHSLDLTSYANLMKGDKEGKVVIAGKPGDSRLSKAVHRKGAAPMPPAGPMKAGDVAKIDAWIKAGAKS